MLPFYPGLHRIELVLLYLKICKDRAANIHPVGIFLPNLEVLQDVDPLYAVQSYDIKIPDRLVVLRRISRSHDDKALRHTMGTKGLVLQELQHGGCQCLRHAVYLIQEQYSLLHPGTLNLIIDRRNDLGHGVLGNRILLPAIALLTYIRKSDGRLPGMMRDGIGHQVNVKLLRNLLHDGSFSYSGRSHEEHRSLFFHRNPVGSGLILHKISLYCIYNFLFRFFDVHNNLCKIFYTHLVFIRSSACRHFLPKTKGFILSNTASSPSPERPCH